MKLTLSHKLFGVAGISVIALIAIAAISYSANSVMISGYQDMEDTDGTQLRTALHAENELGLAVQAYKNFVLRGDDTYVEEFRKSITEIRTDLSTYEKLSEGDELVRLKQAMEAFQPYEQSIDLLVQARKTNRDPVFLDKSMRGVDKPVRLAFQEMSKRSIIMFDEKKAELRKLALKMQMLVIAIALIAIIICIAVSALIIRGILKAVSEVRNGAEKAAVGDLTKDNRCPHQR